MNLQSSDSPELSPIVSAPETGAGNAGGVPENRGPDRRQSATPRFSFYALFGGRRAQVRRTEEKE